MAFATTTIFDMQNGGSDTANGGGFDAGNANFATDLAATTATGVPVCTSASYNFVAGDVGAWLYIKAGTNWIPGWYQIASVSSNAATLTATIGSAYLMGSNVPVGFNTATGCATTASPTGGTWGVDYSRSTAPAISYTDLVIGATTTQFTSVAHPVGPNLVGNMMAVTNGTGFTVQTIQIVSTSTITATCDKSLGTTASTGGTGGLGGSIATLGQASKLVNSATDNGCTVFFKYNATPTAVGSTANAAGGRWASNNGANLIGWDTNRSLSNADANRPRFQASANAINMIGTGGGGTQWINNLIIDGNGHTGCNAINTGAASNFTRCKVMAVANGIFVNNASVLIDRCEANACTTVGFELQQSCVLERSDAIGCAIGIDTAAGTVRINECTVTGSTGVGVQLGTLTYIDHLTVNGSGGSGITLGTTQQAIISNTLSYGAVVDGFHCSGATTLHRLYNCAGGGNGGVNYSTTFWPMQVENFVALTADPFTSKSASPPDLSLNSTTGGGAACKGAGVSTSPVGLAGTSSPDIGAYQSAGAAAAAFPVLGCSFIKAA